MKKIKVKEVNYKQIPINLLLLADPLKKSIENYLKKGICFAAFENNEIVGVCILIKKKKPATEIINIAVVEKKQNKGIGKILIKNVIKWNKNNKNNKILVGTGNSSIYQIAFYQKCGFRIVGIKSDFFVKKYKKPISENGIQCRDMIILELIIN